MKTLRAGRAHGENYKLMLHTKAMKADDSTVKEYLKYEEQQRVMAERESFFRRKEQEKRRVHAQFAQKRKGPREVTKSSPEVNVLRKNMFRDVQD